MRAQSGKRVEVGGAYLSYSKMPLKSGQMYEYQAEFVEAEGNVIVLDAPTGSGKTLAALKRVIDRGVSAIFVYPTNALVQDQLRAMKQLLEKQLGLKPNIIGPDPDTGKAYRVDEIEERMRSTDIDLLFMTGDTLEALSASTGGKSKGSILDLIFTATHKSGRIRILLTNPDTLYLAFIGKYYRHGRISEQIDTFQTIVLDEFHLYSGPLLAKILYMINVVRGNPSRPSVELIILSATHGDALRLLIDSYSDLRVVKAKPLNQEPKSGRPIRQKSICEVRVASGVLSDETKVKEVAEAIITFYDAPLDGQTPRVKVLAIFSSVYFSVQVTEAVRRILKERGLESEKIVHQIHGLIPKEDRLKTIDDLENAILIGTSAIEVGIDFNVPFLIFEALDVGSFLQRFGRGGRHQECQMIMYVPLSLETQLTSKASFTFTEFVELVHNAMDELPSYADFVCSAQANRILLSMALAASHLPDFRHRKDSWDFDAAVNCYETILKSNAHLKIGDLGLATSIGHIPHKRLERKMKDPVVRSMIKHGFLRGMSNMVMVRYSKSMLNSQVPIYATVDLFDLFKMKGYVEPAEKHWERLPSRIRRMFSKEDPIFIAEEFTRPEYPRVVIQDDARCRKRPALYKREKCHLKFGNKRLEDLGEKILHRRNIVFHWMSLNRNTDYRIPRLFVDGEQGGLVVGEWSFVAEYLVSKRTGGSTIQ